MFEKIRRNKLTRGNIQGIGFDQYYTDCALKLLAPKSYLKHRKRIKTKRLIQKQDVLVSLLLFGKAYLSWPSWLDKAEFPDLEKFEKEDLVEWMPDATYESSFNFLELLATKMQCADFLAAIIGKTPLPIDIHEGLRRRDVEKVRNIELEMELQVSDLYHDISSMFRRIFYFSPLIEGNLNHLGYSLPEAESTLDAITPHTLGRSGEDETIIYEFRDVRDHFNGSFLGMVDYFRDEETDDYSERNLAVVFDAALSSLAAEKFAAETSLPLKSNGKTPKSRGGKNVPQVLKVAHKSEVYQLVKIQFHDLRYPVVESIEDVLRLRDDPHLKSYRTVIAEYSERLREELERERPQIIKDFRNDMQLALKSLSIVRRWTKIIDLSFYISLPLVVIGTLYGLPLSDILAIPLTSYAKIVSYQKRKELDWILFGRHDSA